MPIYLPRTCRICFSDKSNKLRSRKMIWLSRLTRAVIGSNCKIESADNVFPLPDSPTNPIQRPRCSDTLKLVNTGTIFSNDENAIDSFEIVRIFGIRAVSGIRYQVSQCYH